MLHTNITWDNIQIELIVTLDICANLMDGLSVCHPNSLNSNTKISLVNANGYGILLAHHGPRLVRHYLAASAIATTRRGDTILLTLLIGEGANITIVMHPIDQCIDSSRPDTDCVIQ